MALFKIHKNLVTQFLLKPAGFGNEFKLRDLFADNLTAQLRYLPPYSPDMNSIEKAYSKLKAYLRKNAERTVAGLMSALENCANIFNPAECENYFKACGYDTN